MAKNQKLYYTQGGRIGYEKLGLNIGTDGLPGSEPTSSFVISPGEEGSVIKHMRAYISNLGTVADGNTPQNFEIKIGDEILYEEILPVETSSSLDILKDALFLDYIKINSGSDITITRTYDEPNDPMSPTSQEIENLEKNGIILYVILEDY